jgi:hypothetical protein
MPRAFAIQHNPVFHIGPAEKYGTISYLYTDNSKMPSVAYPQALLADMLERLQKVEFNAKEDFLILSGGTVQLIAFVSAALLEYGVVKVLLYDHKHHSYYEREMRD